MKKSKKNRWVVFDALKYPELTNEVKQKCNFPRIYDIDKERVERNDNEINKTIIKLLKIHWDIMRDANITVLSSAFSNALILSPISFSDEDIVLSFGGQALSGALVDPLNDMVIFYDIWIYSAEEFENVKSYRVDGNPNYKPCMKVGAISCFDSNGAILVSNARFDNDGGLYSEGFASEACLDFIKGLSNEDLIIGKFYYQILKYHLFKEFAPIETKIVNRNSKIFNPKTSRVAFENNSNQDVEYLDCTWFTTIIRNEPFGVRGHFRLQPYKNEDGEWTKKFIYIKPFQKSGIIRKAKKLNN